uniref:NAD(P)-binding domain-containing protein n=1 Tax=Aegilops tauschii subsp. strangulata TaxID=200361 RepID=A0A453I3B3_AEGTS
VTKYNEIPWSIMNLFGVLKYKKMAEDFVRNSGIPFTIIRPGRLTDGPYTSYDLNTLVKATAGERRAVEIGQGVTSLWEKRADWWWQKHVSKL